MYLSVLAAIRGKKGEEIFGLVKKLYEEGADLAQFAKGLFEAFRNLLMLKTAPKAEALIEASPEMVSKLRELASDFSQGELLLALSILQNLQVQLRRPVAPPYACVPACWTAWSTRPVKSASRVRASTPT